eukprot:1161671-Pelagomonas_calceolata.AAC.3
MAVDSPAWGFKNEGTRRTSKRRARDSSTLTHMLSQGIHIKTGKDIRPGACTGHCDLIPGQRAEPPVLKTHAIHAKSNCMQQMFPLVPGEGTEAQTWTSSRSYRAAVSARMRRLQRMQSKLRLYLDREENAAHADTMCCKKAYICAMAAVIERLTKGETADQEHALPRNLKVPMQALPQQSTWFGLHPNASTKRLA